MAIELFSGYPGAGKTLMLVTRLVDLHRKDEGRAVFYHGIDGLAEGLAEPCDPTKWQDLPDGSIVVVDEVQNVWPQRTSGRQVPAEVAALTEHRHRGFDFLVATQDPKLIDSALRRLCQPHVHLVRPHNWGRAVCFHWEEGQEDVKSKANRRNASVRRWRFPKRNFELYKSSSLHTMKARWSRAHVFLWVALVVAPLALGLAVWKVVGLGGDMSHHDAEVAKAPTMKEGFEAIGGRSGDKKWATVEDYVRDHLPRVAGQPWSAPVFDSLAVRAVPDLLCIEYHQMIAGRDQDLCSCYTEQVTPYELHSLEECRRYARDGVYNPRRAPLTAQGDYGRPVGSSGGTVGAGTPAPAGGPASAATWQPGWRTRSYVQPERTAVTVAPSGAWGK